MTGKALRIFSSSDRRFRVNTSISLRLIICHTTAGTSAILLSSWILLCILLRANSLFLYLRFVRDLKLESWFLNLLFQTWLDQHDRMSWLLLFALLPVLFGIYLFSVSTKRIENLLHPAHEHVMQLIGIHLITQFKVFFVFAVARSKLFIWGFNSLPHYFS